MNLERLKTLCNLNGASGMEDAVRDYIISQISGKCEYKIDSLGNIIAFKKGKHFTPHRLMISAHMDEVGMIVTSVKPDGTLTFDTVGGIDASVIAGRQVFIGKNNLNGVIGSKAVHNLSKEEREKPVSIEKLYADFGAKDKDDALKYVSVGDYIHFSSQYTEFGDGFVKAKAIDDRFGCLAMLNIIDTEIPYDTYFTFVVQEEIGLRGAKAAAYTVNPDFAIVLEATTAGDIADVSGGDKVCSLGEGAVVSFMDRSTVYDRKLYSLAFDAARENNIPCQTKTRIAGGNDSGAIHISRGGVRTLAISVPCRYLHSPSCVIKKSDAVACMRLTEILMEKVQCL